MVPEEAPLGPGTRYPDCAVRLKNGPGRHTNAMVPPLSLSLAAAPAVAAAAPGDLISNSPI